MLKLNGPLIIPVPKSAASKSALRISLAPLDSSIWSCISFSILLAAFWAGFNSRACAIGTRFSFKTPASSACTSTGGTTKFYKDNILVGTQSLNSGAKAVGCQLRNVLELFNEKYESSGTSGGTTGDRYTGNFYVKNIQLWEKELSLAEIRKWGNANYDHYHRENSQTNNTQISWSCILKWRPSKY